MRRTPLRRYTPLRRVAFRSKPKRRVFPCSLEAELWARDGGCVAPLLDTGIDPCDGPIERDHVLEGYGGTSMRARNEAQFLQLVCRHHHHDGWATNKVNREKARVRLGIDGPLGPVVD